MDNIIMFTGCLPPCKYTEFSLPYTPVGASENFTWFSLKFSQSPLILKKEVFVYPLTSLGKSKVEKRVIIYSFNYDDTFFYFDVFPSSGIWRNFRSLCWIFLYHGLGHG